MTPEERAAEDRELKVLQDAIYRDKVLRARKQTVQERISDTFELWDAVVSRMTAGAMAQKKLKTEDEGLQEVRRRLAVLRRVHEHGLYQPVAS